VGGETNQAPLINSEKFRNYNIVTSWSLESL
jgi:hypothetical protein